jgi:hypothetical protein
MKILGEVLVVLMLVPFVAIGFTAGFVWIGLSVGWELLLDATEGLRGR